MPTQARVEIKPRDNGYYQLIVDGVDISEIVSPDNFRIDWIDQKPVISLQLNPIDGFTADLPDAVLRLADSEPAERPYQCALLVALNEDDANHWRHAGGTRRTALTHGNSPLRSVEGLRVTDVYITPRAAEGERYKRIVDTVRQSLRLMGADPSTAINYLGDQREA